jgi:lipoate-protein ligase A
MDSLQLWLDPCPREGPENMAMDEWLLQHAGAAVLRIYRWKPGWGSFGYFVEHAEAQATFPGLRWVRRRTGGGIVDHRRDWTYTLSVPAVEGLAKAKGGESYRRIHQALAASLAKAGFAVRLAADHGPTRGGECFVRPVEFDLMNEHGVKIAGAGQRRSAFGLLHQGSVALPELPETCGPDLARRLARSVKPFAQRPAAEELAIFARQFRDPAWTDRR